MPVSVVKTARDEHLWDRAKEQAKKHGKTKDYAYIMGIFQKMSGEKSMVNMLAGGEDELIKARGKAKVLPGQAAFDFGAKPKAAAKPSGGGKKEGEGSRGGVVVGHTSSGKPIYKDKGKKKEKVPGYDSEQNERARIETMKNRHGLTGELHNTLAERSKNMGHLRDNQKAHLSDFHQKAADAHFAAEKDPKPSIRKNAHLSSAQAFEQHHKVHYAHHKQASIEGSRQEGDAHRLAAKRHKDAAWKFRNVGDYYKEGNKHAGKYYAEARDLGAGADRTTSGIHKAVGLMDEFDKLEKAAGGKIIGRTSDGKEVYAHNGGDVLQKQQTKKAAAQGPSKTNAQAPAHQENTLDKNQEEPAQEGTHEHHRDQALAHLQAAQAHASAAHSAKKVDQAKEHNEIVGEARKATEVTAKMPPKEVKKSMSKNNLNIDLSAEDYILKGLEDSTFNLGGQAAGIREDGRHRVHGMRRMEKGVIYPGELMGVPRGGDNRESVMRAVEDAEGEYLDEAGNRGQGGLADWFLDAWGGQPNVNVPVGIANKGWQKSEPPTVILDDLAPMNRQLNRSDDQISVIMAHQGDNRGLKR